MGITGIFDLSQRSLATYQRAIDLSGHNIANASNENYARQKVGFTSLGNSGSLGIGTGVTISSIQRVKDNFLQTNIFENSSTYYGNSKRSELLERVENSFMEFTDSSFSESLEGFFSSWQELAASPDSTSLRNNVVYSAQQLSGRVKDVHDNIDQISSDIVSELKEKTKNLNSYLKTISELNVEITKQQSSDINVNQLLDERDRIIEEVSKLANIKTTMMDDLSVTVSVGGVTAATNAGYQEFEVLSEDGKIYLATKEDKNKTKLTEGELGGLTTVYNDNLTDTRDQFDNIIEAMVEAVNTVHSGGYNSTNPPVNGIDFFSGYSNGDLRINSVIEDDIANLATSIDGTSGNGDVANSLAGIIDTDLFGNGTSISDKYNSLISKVGSDKQLADSNAASSELLINQLSSKKQEISGVSLDEEMTNIMKYQRSYEASAKLINIADEMLQTLLGLV